MLNTYSGLRCRAKIFSQFLWILMINKMGILFMGIQLWLIRWGISLERCRCRHIFLRIIFNELRSERLESQMKIKNYIV